ncbi:MAG: LamG-like jellyroll fold domain-containing protein [Candidatus Micrarchaeota archaeon]
MKLNVFLLPLLVLLSSIPFAFSYNITEFTSSSWTSGTFVNTENVTNDALRVTSDARLSFTFNTNYSITNITTDNSLYNNQGYLRDVNGSNTATDTQLNGPEWNSTGGPFNEGYYAFDGVDDVLEVIKNANFQPTTGNLTYSAWVKSSNTGIYDMIMGDYDPYSGKGCAIRMSGTGGAAPTFACKAASGLTTAYAAVNINNNVWHLVTGVWNGTTVSIYVDGIASGHAAASGAITYETAKNLTIGHNSFYYQVQAFNGNISEPRIFTRALSAAEILTMNSSYAWNTYINTSANYTSQELVVNSSTFKNITINGAFNTNGLSLSIDTRTAIDAGAYTDWNSCTGLDLTQSTSTYCNVTSVLGTKIQYRIISSSPNTSVGWNITNLTIGYDSDIAPPNVDILYPLNTSYAANISRINYTSSETGFCWYSKDNGATNSTAVTPGNNFTDIISIEGSNTWKVYCNDSMGNTNSTNVTFYKDTIAPSITSDSITSTLSSGENATVRANITDSSALSWIWFTINNSDGALTNYTMSQEGSTTFYNASFEIGKNGTWYYKVYANDTYGQLNDTMAWQSFTVSVPSATAQNEVYPTYALPSSSIKITADLVITDLVKELNATLNTPAGFSFPFTSYTQTQLGGNLSASQTKTVTWYAYLPNTEATYTFNVTWKDKYNNAWQGSNKQIIVSYDTANLTSRIVTLEGLVSTLQTDVATLQTNATNLRTDLIAVNTSINSVNTTVQSNLASITTVQTDIITLQNNVLSINTTVNQHAINITNLSGNVTQINSDILSINNNLTLVWNNVTDLYNDVSNNTLNITDLTTNITSINAQITTINSSINSLNTSINSINSTLTTLLTNSTSANVIVFPETEAGTVLESEIQVRDINGNFANATTVKISLYDPSDNLIVDSANYQTQLGTGRYIYNYTTPTTPTGQWQFVVNVTRNNNSFIDREYFRLTGGPFDIRNITILDDTTPSIQISTILENQGTGTTDIVVNWNLTREDTGALLDSGRDTVGVTSTNTYTINPSTTYTGSARITLIGTWSLTEKASAYKIFTISAPAVSPSASNYVASGSTAGASAITAQATAANVIICNPPYIRFNTNCCLDSNNNSICDKDEKATSSTQSKNNATQNTSGTTIENNNNDSNQSAFSIFGIVSSLFNKITDAISSIKGIFTNNTQNSTSSIETLSLIALIIMLIILIIKFNKIKEITMTFLKQPLNQYKEKPSTRLSSIVNMKVYNTEGDYVGKVKDAILEGSNISGWIIEVEKTSNKKAKKNKNGKKKKNKKRKAKKTTIIIKHDDVKSINKIMIIKGTLH